MISSIRLTEPEAKALAAYLKSLTPPSPDIGAQIAVMADAFDQADIWPGSQVLVVRVGEDIYEQARRDKYAEERQNGEWPD